MVKPNAQPVAAHRRRRKDAAEARQQVINAVVQNTLNQVLYRIIIENAAAQADPDMDTEGKEVTGILTVPMEEIALVPETFAMSLHPDPDKGVLRIHAFVQKEKPNIVLPDGSNLS